MRLGDFFKRRLIRLHPMLVMGVLLGALSFMVQGSVKWDGTPVALSDVMLATLLGLFLIPALPGSAPEVRGNGEMFPLNGPSWSLFSSTSAMCFMPCSSAVCLQGGWLYGWC